jgi:hypothetical protein
MNQIAAVVMTIALQLTRAQCFYVERFRRFPGLDPGLSRKVSYTSAHSVRKSPTRWHKISTLRPSRQKSNIIFPDSSDARLCPRAHVPRRSSLWLLVTPLSVCQVHSDRQEGRRQEHFSQMAGLAQQARNWRASRNQDRTYL